MLKSNIWYNPKYNFIIFSLILLSIRLLSIKLNDLEHYTDQAQYLVWAQFLDFGYYSKLPLVAWLIILSTSLFGDSEFAIRVFSPILHLITGLLVYQISKSLDEERAFLSDCIFITLPAVFISSLIVPADPFLMLLWALSFYFFIKAIDSNSTIYWILVGVTSGLGMLAKYNMLFFLFSTPLYMYYRNKSFKYLYSKNFALALLSAFLIFSPNLFWNINNHFVSFRHTADIAQGDPSNQFIIKKLGGFFFAQFGVFGIINFSVLIMAAYLYVKGRVIEKLQELYFFSISTLVFMIIISFIYRAYANWAALVYITSLILIAIIAKKFSKLSIIKNSIWLHPIIGIVVMLYQHLCNYLKINIASKYGIFKSLKGGNELSEHVLATSHHFNNLNGYGKSVQLLKSFYDADNSSTYQF